MAPRATLEFNLPEENEEFYTASHAGKYYCIIWDILQHLRSVVKYGEDEQKADYADEIREKLYELICDSGVAHDF